MENIKQEYDSLKKNVVLCSAVGLTQDVREGAKEWARVAVLNEKDEHGDDYWDPVLSKSGTELLRDIDMEIYKLDKTIEDLAARKNKKKYRARLAKLREKRDQYQLARNRAEARLPYINQKLKLESIFNGRKSSERAREWFRRIRKQPGVRDFVKSIYSLARLLNLYPGDIINIALDTDDESWIARGMITIQEKSAKPTDASTSIGPTVDNYVKMADAATEGHIHGNKRVTFKFD